MISVIKYSPFFILCILISLSCSPAYTAQSPKNAGSYKLSLSFNLTKRLLTGTARVTLQPGPSFSLSVAGLTVTGTLLKGQSGREKKLTAINDIVVIPASDSVRELYVSYTKKTSDNSENLINQEGIALVSNWHPIPEMPMKFTLTATLPKTFIAVVESDNFPLQRTKNIATATFSQPLYSLHFTAGPYHHKKRKVREGLFIHSLFFAEEQHLADDYLQAGAAFINRYEKEIGPYPYNHYVIAANRLPTGFGIPGYTLIGQMVLRLPFIKDTSLGHEILHSWFGNSVEVDYTEGNWCEGLTSYLADHSYRAEKGEGKLDRKEAITNYISYINQDTVIPLKNFTSAGHNRALVRARRAVGYTRGALLFHELQEKIGDNSFKDAIRLFYEMNNGQEASWTDLRESFETSSGQNLKTFFQERLNRSEIPYLKIQGIKISSLNSKPVLSFTLSQQTEHPFSILVPFQVKSTGGTTFHKQFIEESDTKISIELDNYPLEIAIDPEYSFLRTLSQPELPAVWARFIGDTKKLVILASEKERETFNSLLQSLASKNLTVKTAGEVSNQELVENSLLFLDSDQHHALSLFGNPYHNDEGFTLDVRTNPLNPEHLAVLVSSSAKTETDTVARRLSHYGKYSFLHFLHGKNQKKKIEMTQSGIHVVLDVLPIGGKTSDFSSFDRIIDELNKSRVVYIGETHNSLTDHRLQLRIIEALYKRDPNLAIGMEMFPSSKQPALDRYISGNTDIDEQTFLKESEYFKVWSYDYHFFRDIINFAKVRTLPVRGLNLNKEIVSNVFRSGNTDKLEETVLQSLPKERNLGMNGYRERLEAMHATHMQGSHGKGNAAGFIQAQGLWDESMAENIVNYLIKHPEQRMVVLAGSQHTRKDSGIPPRVKGRIDIKQSSVLNIAKSTDQTNLEEIADFFFISNPIQLPESPKIGIVLAPATKDSQNFLKISQISPHGKAEEAGLQAGDILKELDGFPIEEMSDLRIAMIDAEAGETVTIVILRGEGQTEVEMEFTVELSLSPPPMMHP